MNKQYFMETLRYSLSAMPEKERNDLLQDYEAHFTYGRECGRTEEEVVHMLGDPVLVAREAMGRWIPAPAYPAQPPSSKSTPRTIGMMVALFFKSLFAIPVFAALWAFLVAAIGVATVGVLAPGALALEHFLYDGYATYKVYLAIGNVGVGMLMFAVSLYYGKWLMRVSRSYIGWNGKKERGSIRA